MENQNNENAIIITDENGTERTCEVLFTYQDPETNKNYVVFYPTDVELDEDDEAEGDLYAFSFIETEDGQGELFPLESDEEIELINDVIDQFFEDQLNEEK